jgi:catechol 2,3-dioxygenase-like lactoylglutathione lyase family enzyme
MIDHSGVSVSDVAKSKAFYRSALAPLGYTLLMEWEEFAGFGVAPKPDFWIGQGKPNVPPIHIAFRAESRAQVDAFYRSAMLREAPITARRVRVRNIIRITTVLLCWTRGHNIEAVTTRRYNQGNTQCQHAGSGRLLAFAAAAITVRRPDWPDKPIKFIVAAPAGSSLDVLARMIGDRLKDRLGQPIVVDDRPAAGGTVATDLVAKSPPDGYTMVISFNGPLAFGPHLYAKLPYDPQKDLAAVIITSSQPNVLAVNVPIDR